MNITRTFVAKGVPATMRMKLHFNDLTKQRLSESLGDKPGYFKLFYDTEDCGCNGILVILIVDAPYHTDLEIQTESFRFLMDRQQSQQFDEVMQLEADPNYPSFVLKSDGSVFNRNLRIRDVRKK